MPAKAIPETPILTVDGVINFGECIVLIKKEHGWALPGGKVKVGETVEQAIAREIREETNLIVESVRFVGVFSDPERDSRGHYITVAFEVKAHGELIAGSDAKNVQLVNKREIDGIEMEYKDHPDIIQRATETSYKSAFELWIKVE